MASNRRIGAENWKGRAALLDATEQIMLEEGYAAVSSRRIAQKAGLKPQLVDYYFRTMDDLFLAAFRRRAEEGLERQAEALTSGQPLRTSGPSATTRPARHGHGIRRPGQPPQVDTVGDCPVRRDLPPPPDRGAHRGHGGARN